MDNQTALEQIDVEALLARAYREKRVHLLGAPRDGNAERLLGRLIGLTAPSTGGGGWGGEVVDTSTYAAKVVARTNAALESLRLASDALLDLHGIVLDALPDFYVEQGAGLDFLVWDAQTAARLGHRIEHDGAGATIMQVRRRGGRGRGSEDLVPNGPRRRVRRIVTASLLVQHGASASRPDVAEVVEIARKPIYAGARKQAVGYEVVYETDLATVALERAIYAAWHAALGMIVELYARHPLPGYVVTGPSAPATPWDAPVPALRESVLPGRPVEAVAPPAHRVEWPKPPRKGRRKGAPAQVPSPGEVAAEA